MSPIPQTSFLFGTFFAVSYSKPALIKEMEIRYVDLLLTKYASNAIPQVYLFLLSS